MPYYLYKQTKMKQILLALTLLGLLAAACQSVPLSQEVPSSPKESYEQLPQ